MPADELTPAGSPDLLELLASAEIDIEGRMPWSSNATFLVNLLIDGSAVGQGIYKPLRGERPLWDFEPGLHRRELAAYLLSEAMDLHLVPPTIIRDGPVGEGSVQWFVNADHQQHYFTIYENREDLHERLRDFAAFDFIANNTDRKSGHVLIDDTDGLWGIDHGLCFAAEFKLRTVVWEFGGQPLPEHLLDAACRIATTVPLEVAAMLNDEEAVAVQERAQWLVDTGALPTDPTGRRYPWPLV
ncbi:MAG: SCO1664 family protein [Actinomycetota bacterium]